MGIKIMDGTWRNNQGLCAGNRDEPRMLAGRGWTIYHAGRGCGGAGDIKAVLR